MIHYSAQRHTHISSQGSQGNWSPWAQLLSESVTDIMHVLALFIPVLAVFAIKVRAQDDGCVATCIRELVAGCDSM